MMEKTQEMTVRISAAAHRRFVTDALRAAGADEADAGEVADGLLWTDLRGRHTHGLTRLPNIVERLSKGLVRSPAEMTWQEVAPAAALLDAGHGLGHVAGKRAVMKAVQLAHAQGVGMVAVRHSNHFGAAGYYCALAAEEGCLSLNFTNAFAKVAPYGGRRPALGVNPIAFGCPRRGAAPLMVDLSTSAIAGASVRSAAGNGRLLPSDAALDAEGNPTMDPAAVKAGCLLPAGGPRGFALGLMVEILSGVLTGSAVGREVGSLFFTWDRPVDVGHLFIAADIGRFLPPAEFIDRLEGLLAAISATPPREGFESVRIPGEIRAQLAGSYEREGIPLAPESAAPLAGLARRFNLPLPWDNE